MSKQHPYEHEPSNVQIAALEQIGAKLAEKSTEEPRSKEPRGPRPSFEEIYTDLSILFSRRSTCRRLQVGCVITSYDYRQVLGVGYNGNVSGGHNDCDRVGEGAVGNCGCIHAEQNAVINCRAHREQGKMVFSSNLPCLQCAKFLVNLGGVVCVHYAEDYRVRDALLLFRERTIMTYHMGTPGPMIDKFNASARSLDAWIEEKTKIDGHPPMLNIVE